MRRVLGFLLFLALALGAASKPPAQVQLLAAKVTRQGDIVRAEGDVVVYYREMILEAKRAIYDTRRGVMELFGEVTLSRGREYTVLSDYVYLDFRDEKDIFKNYFLTGFETGLWARGKDAVKVKDKIDLKKALLSSCDVGCPDWHIEFSDADYNTTTHWLDLWNPRFYIRDTPVFYLPYIGTSLIRERKSGLLRPNFGISNRDGFTYEQSYYIAIDPWWDLEITPQLRTDRGAGAYATFRFADSPHSHGSVRAGYFRSKDGYVTEYNLKNHSHYGFQIHYENRSPLTQNSKDYDDGLYVDVTWLNDPDYINLQATSTAELAGSSQVQSRINYFFNTPTNYVGLYGKYFIDTSLSTVDRRNTFQNVPTLQLHHYQTSLAGLGFLQYSADYRFNHYFTESGKHVEFQELNLPLTFYWSFFEDYLKFSVSENIYYSYSAYTNLEQTPTLGSDYYALFRNYHTVDLYTDLARGFDNGIFHTIQLRVTYNKPSFSKERGDTVDVISVLRSPRENLMMSAINYLYNTKGAEFLYYRIAQPVLFEPADQTQQEYNRYGDLEQEIRYRFLEHYELYTDLFFSYYLHNVSGATSYFKVRYPQFDIMVNHFFKQRRETRTVLDDGTPNPEYGQTVITSDFFTLSGRYRGEDGRDYYAGVSYDNLNSKVNRWNVGTRIFRRCWDLDVGIRDEIVPILTSAQEADNIHNVTFYFTISLVPFGTFTHSIQQGL